MSIDKRDWCTCEKQHTDFSSLTNHYCETFLPMKWELQYGSLDREESERYLYLSGICLHCHKGARSGVSLPGNFTGENLLSYIYNELRRYRPYEHMNSKTGACSCGIRSRALWYQRQDDLPLKERNEQFVQLFHPEDWETVRKWVAENCSEEDYANPQRDRKSTLFCAAIKRARAAGDLAKIEPIVESFRPNEYEPEYPYTDTYLTDYQFNVTPVMGFGSCEGIYVDFYLDGRFDKSDERRTHIGTVKALCSDLEACRLMGELCGVLMYHATAHINQNIHRYTPEHELRLELQKRVEKQERERKAEQK